MLAAVTWKSYPPSLFKTLLGQYNLKEGPKVSCLYRLLFELNASLFLRMHFMSFICFFFKACDWGILHEPRAKQHYTECTGLSSRRGDCSCQTVACSVDLHMGQYLMTALLKSSVQNKDYYIIICSSEMQHAHEFSSNSNP